MLFVASIALFLTACSTQIGYRFADTFVEWELNKFVDLNDAQKQQVDIAITELHHWHATNELPFYAEQLQILRDKIATQSLTEADIAETYDIAIMAWQRMLTGIEPYALTLLPNLTDAQLAQIEVELAKRLAEEREELAEAVASDERQAQLRKRARKNAQNWLRRVTPVQERLLNQWSDERLPTRELWLAYTAQWHGGFLQALNERRNLKQFPTLLNQLLFNSDTLYSAELAERVAHNRELTMALMHDLYQSLTNKQRQRIVAKLDEYIEDCNELALFFEERGLD
ncbi:hypothetical protein CWE24_05360 [Pseudidiomarina donghaiensis]|uniref:Lipoprotein n=2 Tax=Pseudidiomarina donghaiensis TaxID=519452 RepID=A0A432XMG8_9GAMM|nr:hypothetical protein CWE24_05360 [Pseudidiomarina donghaiensis]